MSRNDQRDILKSDVSTLTVSTSSNLDTLLFLFFVGYSTNFQPKSYGYSNMGLPDTNILSQSIFLPDNQNLSQYLLTFKPISQVFCRNFSDNVKADIQLATLYTDMTNTHIAHFYTKFISVKSVGPNLSLNFWQIFSLMFMGSTKY